MNFKDAIGKINHIKPYYGKTHNGWIISEMFAAPENLSKADLLHLYSDYEKSSKEYYAKLSKLDVQYELVSVVKLDPQTVSLEYYKGE